MGVDWNQATINAVLDEVRISKVVRYKEDFAPDARFETDAETLALYHFDEGSGDELKDSSGKGHHGKVVGAKWVRVEERDTTKAAGYELEFDGQAYVCIPSLQYDGSHPITVEAYITAAPYKDNYVDLISNTQVGGISFSMYPANGVGSTVGMVAGFNGATYSKAGSSELLKYHRRTHLAGTLDGKKLRAYIDGKMVGEAEFAVEFLASDVGFALGVSPNRDGKVDGNGFFVGRMGNVRISKVVRYDGDFTPPSRFQSDRDTLALYSFDEGQGDKLTDSSGNGHHGLIAGAKWVPASSARAWHAWSAGTPPPALAPFDAEQAKQHQAAWAKSLGVPVEYTNSIGMKFRLIPPGQFVMGSPESEQGREAGGDKGSEKQHEVVITRPFYLSVFEVTQPEYAKLMGANPSARSEKGNEKDRVQGVDTSRIPVESVSWNDAQAFCRKLSELSAEKGVRYRLPTEAEWEYAFRAGTTEVFYVGNTLTSHQDHFAHKFSYGTTTEGPNAGDDLNVGRYAANPFGLHDMIGSVCEWCEDAYDYGSDYYARSPLQDPWNKVGVRRARRGGAFSGMGMYQRAALRYSEVPTHTMPDLGFRVVLEIDERTGGQAAVDPDRRAAEWVLSIGGYFKINEKGKESYISAVGNLPRGAFDLKDVQLSLNQKVNDAGLAHFKDCKNLTYLDLAATKVSDAGLAHFQDCKNLSGLNLASTQVSDAGLAYFKDWKNLTFLGLDSTKVGDAGLAHFKDCKNLIDLRLRGTQVTDAGLDYFKDCKNLPILVLSGTQVTEAGVKKLSAALPGCKIEWNGGVIEPKQSTNSNYALRFDANHKVVVTSLKLPRAGPVTIEGYLTPSMKGAKKIIHILGATSCAVYGHESSRWALIWKTGNNSASLAMGPIIEDRRTHVAGVVVENQLRLFVDGKLVGTRPIPNPAVSDILDPFVMGQVWEGVIDEVRVSRIARYDKDFVPETRFVSDKDTLALYHFDEGQGGDLIDSSGNNLHGKIVGAKWVKVDGTATDPDRRAAEWVLSIGGSIKIQESGKPPKNIEAVGDLPQGTFKLIAVDVGGNSKVSDTGLIHFQNCENLAELSLGKTQVSDVGLAHFKNCTNLSLLFLDNTKVTDVGLAHFKGCQNLQVLNLMSATQVTDAGVAHFQDCKDFTDLLLSDTQVSDAGLVHFRECKNLATLYLNSPQVSDAGLAHLKDCKNVTVLRLNNTQVSDAGLERLTDFPNLKHLYIPKTKVTEAGVKKLSAALPGCKIAWDGGVIEPRVAPIR